MRALSCAQLARIAGARTRPIGSGSHGPTGPRACLRLQAHAQYADPFGNQDLARKDHEHAALVRHLLESSWCPRGSAGGRGARWMRQRPADVHGRPARPDVSPLGGSKGPWTSSCRAVTAGTVGSELACRPRSGHSRFRRSEARRRRALGGGTTAATVPARLLGRRRRRAYGDTTTQAVMALQKAVGLARDGVMGPKSRQALARGVSLQPHSSDGHWIEIDKSRQLLMLVDGGRVSTILNTSTGSDQPYSYGGTTTRPTPLLARSPFSARSTGSTPAPWETSGVPSTSMAVSRSMVRRPCRPTPPATAARELATLR